MTLGKKVAASLLLLNNLLILKYFEQSFKEFWVVQSGMETEHNW